MFFFAEEGGLVFVSLSLITKSCSQKMCCFSGGRLSSKGTLPSGACSILTALASTSNRADCKIQSNKRQKGLTLNPFA